MLHKPSGVLIFHCACICLSVIHPHFPNPLSSLHHHIASSLHSVQVPSTQDLNHEAFPTGLSLPVHAYYHSSHAPSKLQPLLPLTIILLPTIILRVLNSWPSSEGLMFKFMNSDVPSIILPRSCHHHNFEAGEKSPARLQRAYIAFWVDKQTGHGDMGKSRELIEGRQPMELSSQFAMLSGELGLIVVQQYLV